MSGLRAGGFWPLLMLWPGVGLDEGGHPARIAFGLHTEPVPCGMHEAGHDKTRAAAAVAGLVPVSLTRYRRVRPGSLARATLGGGARAATKCAAGGLDKRSYCG
jgi:hypothetical protein